MIRSYLDRHPEDAPCIEYWRQTGQLVPIAQGGEFVALVNQKLLAKTPLPAPLPVADYVVGLELLGFRFAVVGQDGLYYAPPGDVIPDAWEDHVVRIHAAFGRGRRGEAVEFIKERERAAA